MKKVTLYPKTKRFRKEKTIITEKVDGSNLSFFKKNEELFVAQRNNVFSLSEIQESDKELRQKIYNGLYSWLCEYGDLLKENLHEGSVIIGEWMGMGKINYGNDFNKRFLMFAKANVSDDISFVNLNYCQDNFVYPFIDQTIPEYIGLVPIVKETEVVLDIDFLNELYDIYRGQVSRNVEGFIVNNDNRITKYVRMKNGKLEAHRE